MCPYFLHISSNISDALCPYFIPDCLTEYKYYENPYSATHSMVERSQYLRQVCESTYCAKMAHIVHNLTQIHNASKLWLFKSVIPISYSWWYNMHCWRILTEAKRWWELDLVNMWMHLQTISQSPKKFCQNMSHLADDIWSSGHLHLHLARALSCKMSWWLMLTQDIYDKCFTYVEKYLSNNPCVR